MTRKTLILLICAFSFYGSAAHSKEIIFPPTNMQNETLVLSKQYELFELTYAEPLSVLEELKKYVNVSVSNPEVEVATILLIRAMMNDDYDTWLNNWDDDSKSLIQKEDKNKHDKQKRIHSWNFLKSATSIEIVKFIQTDYAQHTKYLAIMEVKVNKTNTKRILYFPWYTNINSTNGKWNLARKLMEHPAFNEYIN